MSLAPPELRLFFARRPKGSLDLSGAIASPPTTTLSITGAATLELDVADATRALLRAEEFRRTLWATALGINWELRRQSKTGDRIRLTFEDAIVAELRRRTDRLSIAAGTQSRRAIAERLCGEVDVDVETDPEARGVVQRVVERSASGQRSDSWEVLGELADDVRWRRFSDGRRVYIGSDAWLRSQHKPLRWREHRGGVGNIDIDIETGRPADRATVDLDVSAMSLRPGLGVVLEDMGRGDGTWLLEEITQPTTSWRATARLSRPQTPLAEPPKEEDGGESGFVPRPSGDAGSGSGTPSTGQREAMVQWALKQAGKAYVWGGNGPSGFDCSGLVQEASRAAGRVLTKPSASQWATVKASGRTMSVAEGIRTRGALLFKMGGNPNHIAISLGNGSTIEAMGTAYGVLVAGGAANRGWTGAGLWL